MAEDHIQPNKLPRGNVKSNWVFKSQECKWITSVSSPKTTAWWSCLLNASIFKVMTSQTSSIIYYGAMHHGKTIILLYLSSCSRQIWLEHRSWKSSKNCLRLWIGTLALVTWPLFYVTDTLIGERWFAMLSKLLRCLFKKAQNFFQRLSWKPLCLSPSSHIGDI